MHTLSLRKSVSEALARPVGLHPEAPRTESPGTESMPLPDLLGRPESPPPPQTLLWNTVGLSQAHAIKATVAGAGQTRRTGRGPPFAADLETVPQHSCSMKAGALGLDFGCFYLGVGEGAEEREINPQ